MDDYIKRQAVIDAVWPVDSDNDGSDGCTVVLQSMVLTSADVESLVCGIPAAYAYPPARIDREKWELCMWCVPNGQFGLNNYCSACGRPLTEEAWAELERRVCGEV